MRDETSSVFYRIRSEIHLHYARWRADGLVKQESSALLLVDIYRCKSRESA
jgi:hypothetical protein